LHAFGHPSSDSHECAPLCLAIKLRTVRNAEQGVRVADEFDAKAHANRRVREEFLAKRPCRTLRAEHEVYAKAASTGRNVSHDLLQLRVRMHQSLVFVDEYDEPGYSVGHIIARDFPKAEFPKACLPAMQFRAESLCHTHRLVAIEVGHDASTVRQGCDGVKGGATLEVEAEQYEFRARVLRRKRDRPRDKQLALTAPGRASNDCVRAIGHEVDRAPT
jgi:hypothetical protein